MTRVAIWHTNVAYADIDIAGLTDQQITDAVLDLVDRGASEFVDMTGGLEIDGRGHCEWISKYDL